MTDDEHAVAARLVYDSAAADYVAFVGTELSDKTEDAVDRSLLTAFVELAASSGGRPVADLGCGPGRVAASLSRSGVDTIGIDVSSRLIRLAHGAHPSVRFVEGQISDLPLRDGCLGGAVCWYSIIYTPPEKLDRTLTEIGRVVAPGGPVLLAFQAGTAERRRRSNAFGSGHPLTSFRHDPDVVAAKLAATRFAIHSTTLRAPAREHEDSIQAFVVARRQPARTSPDCAAP